MPTFSTPNYFYCSILVTDAFAESFEIKNLNNTNITGVRCPLFQPQIIFVPPAVRKNGIGRKCALHIGLNPLGEMLCSP